MKLKDALNIVFERVIGQNTVDASDMEGMMAPASATKLGGVKVGSGLSVTEDGTLSSSGGGGGGAFIVKDGDGTGTLDKTWQEIHDAALTSAVILASGTIGSGGVSVNYFKEAFASENQYTVEFDNDSSYVANSPNDYPVFRIQ